jgi:hypothetical protein
MKLSAIVNTDYNYHCIVVDGIVDCHIGDDESYKYCFKCDENDDQCYAPIVLLLLSLIYPLLCDSTKLQSASLRTIY